MKQIVRYILLGVSLPALYAAENIPKPSHFEAEVVERLLPRNVLSNQGIVMLADAGYDEDFLIDVIQYKQTRFDTTVEGLTFLANHGISERIIRFMIANENKSAGPARVEAPVAEPNPVPVRVRVRVVKQKVLVPDFGTMPLTYQPAAPTGPYMFANRHLFGNRWYVVNPSYAPASPAVPPQRSWRVSRPAYSQMSYFPTW